MQKNHGKVTEIILPYFVTLAEQMSGCKIQCLRPATNSKLIRPTMPKRLDGNHCFKTGQRDSLKSSDKALYNFPDTCIQYIYA